MAETDFGQTDFGQTDFGHPYLTDFGQSDFAQTECFSLLGAPKGAKGGAPKGGASHPHFRSFSVSLGDTQQPSKAAGVSHDSPELQTCTFTGPSLQKHHQNSTRRHRERKRTKMRTGEGKKRAKYWAVRRRVVRRRAVRRRRVRRKGSGATWSKPTTPPTPQQQTTNKHTAKHAPTQPTPHTHNNTRSGVEAKPRIKMAQKGLGGGPKGGVPKSGAQRVWPPLPGFRVWVWIVW